MSVSRSFLAHMKRLVRSALDPLPRSLSLRSLAILVTMLVGGIAISVHEYLESGKVHAAAPATRGCADAPRPEQRLDEAPELGCESSGVPFEIEPASAGTAASDDWPTESEPIDVSTPGLWTPDARSTGS